ncbi:Protein of unknown function DUF4246 [Penicillium angulare]|uniref:Uncharacterized protein n=1 Tax=Penicillium angulare TaxID=116970 RepID=A0A9W9F3G7_9EURO|nr:Protein of unknown function DUF4246 [Penicillium angulare]
MFGSATTRLGASHDREMMPYDPRSRLQMPGFNVPLEVQPVTNRFTNPEWAESLPPILGFMRALDPIQAYNKPLTQECVCTVLLVTSTRADNFSSPPLTLTEITMMRAINFITEQAEWHSKIFDDESIAAWREELLQINMAMSPMMMAWVINELQQKVVLYKDSEKGLVECFDKGVVKSDTAISTDLRLALKEALALLENASEGKDYEPGSDDKVVNLVDPSLFPVIYGRTRVLPDELVGLENVFSRVGEGIVLPVTQENEKFSRIATINAEIAETSEGHMNTDGKLILSTEFQWLPFDVKITHSSGCQILSYINNIHPIKHQALYKILEEIVGNTIPLWEQSLLLPPTEQRIDYDKVEYDEQPNAAPNPDLNDRSGESQTAQPIRAPEPGDFLPREPSFYFEDHVILRDKFRHGNLQVVLKLFNIELTPDKPDYEGGAWNFDGQLVSFLILKADTGCFYSIADFNKNERICSSAMYFYDNENITEGTVAFRSRGKIDIINYHVENERPQYDFLQKIFGFGPEVRGYGPCQQVTQELGGVICKEGKLIAFPPTVQHRLSPFSLVDKSKPGHCKVLVLSLVDPHRRIISSANVPPQREDWGREKTDLVQSKLAKHLPFELGEMITKDTCGSLMTMEEAKKHRLALKEEHALQSKQTNWNFEMGSLSLYTPE